MGDKPLCICFPRLYNLSHGKKLTVARVFSEGWGVLNFRRNLWGELAIMWYKLQDVCAEIQ